jgi:hypothetical protein
MGLANAHIQGLTVKTVELKTLVARRLTDVQAAVSSTKLVDMTFPVRCQRSKKEAMSAFIIKRNFLTAVWRNGTSAELSDRPRRSANTGASVLPARL